MKGIDRTTNIILLVLGVALLFSTFSSDYDIEAFGGDVSTVFMPRVYFVIWIALTLVLLWQSYRSKEKGEKEDVASSSMARLCMTIIIAAATSVAMLKLGFVIGLIPGFFMFSWIFGYRKPLTLAVISVLGTGIIWIVFNNVFELPLPRSPWFNIF